MNNGPVRVPGVNREHPHIRIIYRGFNAEIMYGHVWKVEESTRDGSVPTASKKGPFATMRPNRTRTGTGCQFL